MFALVSFFNIYDDNKSLSYQYVGNEINVFEEIVIETPKGPYTGKLVANEAVLKTYRGPMTAYGPDCKGCIGYTASGYNVLNGNIYYLDKTYGNIRIVAADKSLPFGTIVKIKGLDIFESDILTIVLDRGSAIGFNKKSYFDLLYNSEKETETFGCKQATYEILRRGF